MRRGSARKLAPTGADFRAYPEPIPDERAVTEALGEIIAASLLLPSDERAPDFVHAEEMTRERPDLILYDSVAM